MTFSLDPPGVKDLKLRGWSEKIDASAVLEALWLGVRRGEPWESRMSVAQTVTEGLQV